MIHKLITCFQLIICTTYGQNHEDFLNDIRHLATYQDCDSILLYKTKMRIYLGKEELNALKHELPKDILEEFKVQNTEMLKKQMDWNFELLIKTKSVSDKDSLRKALALHSQHSDSIFLKEYHLDTLTNFRILDHLIDSLEAIGIIPQKFSTYSNCFMRTAMFSYPIFSINGKWAIISYTSYLQSLNASGGLYIFKRRKSKWVMKKRICSWVS